ncbi:MAG: hypothetical protein E7G83_24380, partial [Klebsiella aerogenes]|nr:hypothetical protein [Klebsiella aerogenes]
AQSVGRLCFKRKHSAIIQGNSLGCITREYSIYTLHPLSDFALAALVHLNRLLVQPTEDSLFCSLDAPQTMLRIFSSSLTSQE